MGAEPGRDAPLFIAGATGYTGAHAVALAAARGLPVVAHVRPGREAPPMPEGVVVDRTDWDPSAMAATLRRLRPRAVLALLGTTRARDRRSGDDLKGYEAIDYGLTHLLLDACRGLEPAPRFVYLSCAGARADAPNAYLAVRGRIEDELRRSGLPWASARPTFVSGPDRPESRPAERVATVLSDGLLGGLAAVGVRGPQRRWGSMSGAQLAAALLTLATMPEPDGVAERPRLAELVDAR